MKNDLAQIGYLVRYEAFKDVFEYALFMDRVEAMAYYNELLNNGWLNVVVKPIYEVI